MSGVEGDNVEPKIEPRHILGMEPENVASQMIRNWYATQRAALAEEPQLMAQDCLTLMLQFNEWLVSTNEILQRLVLDHLNTALSNPIILERVPSSPAPRLEFQADRMTETEWSADTWLVLPNGKREVLGWIPCDSQDDADREVATLKKLYAEAVPSSPAAQKRTLVQQNLVIAAEIHCAMTDQECIPFEGERYFPALSTQKLERILGFHAPPDESIVVQLLRTELLQYSEEVKHLREQLDSPVLLPLPVER